MKISQLSWSLLILLILTSLITVSIQGKEAKGVVFEDTNRNLERDAGEREVRAVSGGRWQRGRPFLLISFSRWLESLFADVDYCRAEGPKATAGPQRPTPGRRRIGEAPRPT